LVMTTLWYATRIKIVHIIHIPQRIRPDRVPCQSLDVARQRACHLGRTRQVLIFFLSQPPQHVVYV